MKQIAFIIHGKIKKQEELVAEIRQALAGSATLLFMVTQRHDHAIELAYDAVNNNATHIICIGGDGSLNEVVNGVMKGLHNCNDAGRAEAIRVGLLPHGTGNDFARTMGVTYNIALLKKLIDDDSFKIIDLGMATYQDSNLKPASRYFVNIADVGIGGAIAYDLANSSKVLGSFLTYQLGILKALITYKNKPVTVVADTFSYAKSIMSLIVANGKYFGGGMGVAPDALPDDKLFSLVIIGEISTWTYLKNLGTIRKCIKVVHPELKYLSASEIQVDSPVGPLPIDMDGEFIGFSPVKMTIVPAALRFISPQKKEPS